MKGLSCVVLILFLSAGFINPQQKNIRQINNHLDKDNRTLTSAITKSVKDKPEKFSSINDTLNYRDCTDLIYSLMLGGQDVVLQWFQAPFDLKIKAFGINCRADSNASVQVGLRKINLPVDSIYKLQNEQLGYYVVQENGKYSFSPFDDNQSDTINWIGKTITGEPFGEDLISDYWPLEVKKENTDEYQWLQMSLLGYFPEIKAGEIVAVTIKNISAVSDSSIIYVKEGCSLKNFGWKYYASDRIFPEDINDSTGIGWWNKEGHTFDFALAVELPCDMIPDILITHLDGTLSTEPREVIAQVYGDCVSGTVTQVILQYKLDDSNDWLDVSMQHDSAEIWKGMIPGQPANTLVTYQVIAMNDDDVIITSAYEGRYLIFGPTPDVKTLIVFNGFYRFSYEKEYPQDYYFGTSDFANYNVRDFKHDVWGYGQLTDELVNYYDNIIEITTPEPNAYNDSVIVKWLDTSPNHNYFLAGQEWLGYRYEYRDSTFLPGSFEYDQLGITHSYNDVSYANNTGYNLPSRLYPVLGSLLCSDLFDLYNLQTPGDSLQYHPYYELGTGYTNWIDGYKVDTNRVEVDMYVETRGIEGQAHVELLPCASHLTLPAGNKIAFFSFDPLALDSSPDYYWYGFSKESPQNKVLDWFGITTEVDDEPVLYPQAFKLYQNYPNPFNPVTKIKYSVPLNINRQPSNITLKVFDVLGREVATLVNKEQHSGIYEVEWDAGSISSGIYFYELRAGDFVAIKKMIILK